MVSIFLQARIELSVERLKRRQTKLVEEWGEGVSGDRRSNRQKADNDEQESMGIEDTNVAEEPR